MNGVQSRRFFICAAICLFMMTIGCDTANTTPGHPLDEALARSSLQAAMQAWVDGKSPKELRPGIVVGDTAWERGAKLTSFQILQDQETTDGSNLHIPVKRNLDNSESTVTYIVGTSPVVTIFPQ